MFDPDYYRGRGSNYILGYANIRPRFFWKRRLALVRSLRGSGRLLDVGCAFGYFLIHLDGTYSTYGMDISDYALSQAKMKFPHPDRLRQENIEDSIPFEENFDLITAFDILEHVKDAESACRNIEKALTPGGYLIIELPTQATPIDRDESHRYRSIETWVDMLQRTGFTIKSRRGFWTVGFRVVLLPTQRYANYWQIVARKAG